LFSLIGEIK